MRFFHIKSDFTNICSFIIYLIPLALISGPLFSDLFVSILGIFAIYIILRFKEFHYLKNKFIIIIFFWWLYLIFLSLSSENIYLSLESSLFYFRFIFFVIAIWIVLKNNKIFLKYFYYFLFFTFFILFFDSFFQLIFKHNLIFFSYEGDRLSSLFGEEKKLGSYISRLLPLLSGLMIFNSNNLFKTKVLLFFLYLLSLILILFSGERSSLFYYILNIILIIIFVKDLRKFFSISISVITLFSGFFILYQDNVRQRMIDNTITRFIHKDQLHIYNNNLNVFSSEHQSIYISAYKIFLDNKIFGIGPKNFRIECLKDEYKVVHSYQQCPSHPHNSYIQLLAETGILGFLFILGLFFLIFYLLIRKKLRINYSFQEKNLYIFLLITCCISLWPLTPTGNFFNNWLNIIYFFPIGFILYFIDKNKIKT